MWSGRRTIQCLEPNIHRWRHLKDCCVPFFPHVLEVAQSDYMRRDSTAIGIIRALSRIVFFSLSTYGWSTRFRLLLSCLREPCESYHSEWSRNSTLRHSEANISRTHGQTFTQLDVQTSHFLFHTEVASWRPQILFWPVLRFCRI